MYRWDETIEVEDERIEIKFDFDVEDALPDLIAYFKEKGVDLTSTLTPEDKKLYFEGGQTPITRRLPKRGFNNSNFKVNYQIVNVGDIEKIESKVKEIDAQWLFENGLIHSKEKPVKILGNGDLSKVIEIKANAFSQTARDKIEKVKGKAEVIGSA